MKRIPAALALGGLLLAGGAFAAPPNAYQGTPEKKDEAVRRPARRPASRRSPPRPEAKPEEKKGGMTAATFAGLELRNIGPAWSAAASSTSRSIPARRAPGTSRPPRAASGRPPTPAPPGRRSSTAQGSYSIGCVTIDPKNPLVVWVGTGENNSQRSVAYGDGVYKSTDGGKSWKNVGLKKSEHIGKIVDRSARLERRLRRGAGAAVGGRAATAASTRPPTAARPGRRCSTISENTGVTDVVLDPRNPGRPLRRRLPAPAPRLDADRRRPRERPSTSRPTAARPGRSSTSGLPDGDMGRIGLAISPLKPDIVYATSRRPTRRAASSAPTTAAATGRSAATPSPAARSTTRRSSSTRRTPTASTSMDVFIQVTDDGGKTLPHRSARSDKHVDNHVVWIDPANTRPPARRLRRRPLRDAGTAARTGASTRNLPITQFYRVERRQRHAVLQRLRRHPGQLHASAARRGPPTTTASATPTGSSPRAATASSRRSTPRTRTSSTPSRSTAASCATTGGPASSVAHPAAAGQGRAGRCAGTGTRR